jgi:serine/threonine-protein kinase
MAREVRALEQVRGMGVPAVLDHNMWSMDDTSVPLYFVSEWVEGGTLQNRTNGKALPIEDALKITRELAEVVGRCHAVGVCHRDIKPDNVVVSANDSSLTLVDFGIAFATPNHGESDFRTEASQELGNRFLRIPDLSAGQPERRDPRSDVTLVVGVLFYLLSGRAPRTLVDQELRPPHARSPNLFPDATTSNPWWTPVRRILDVGFQPAVNLRFQSADELVDRIDEVLNPLEPAGPTGGYREELAALREFLGSAVADSFRRVEQAMLESSRKLEDRLETMANEEGLMSVHFSVRARVLEAGRSVQFACSLRRAEADDPSAEVVHTVELVGSGRSYVRATYDLDASVGHGRAYYQRVPYYTGPAADTERLEEELLARAEEIFECAIRVLREQLGATLGDSPNDP